MERQSGLIDILRKDDEVYLDLGAEQLGRTYVMLPAVASGVGNGAFAGRTYQPLLLTFRRVGKRLLWISPNPNFGAAPGSAAGASLAVSVADSVLAVTPILAEDTERKRVIVSPSALFLSDFENVGRDLGRGQPPALPLLFSLAAGGGFSLDTQRSYYVRTKALPANDEFLVNLTFNGQPGALQTVPDARGVPVKIHYSIAAAPEDDGYTPRLADDRVGYFISAQKQFGDDTKPTPFVRYIDRWNLDRGPVTYYLTKEIPPEYRDTVRRALLTWNDAFARIGYPQAIEVRDQPDDPGWDPEDARYTAVRWITSDHAQFSAYGPRVSDPRTGEILGAALVIDGESMRAIKRGYVDSVAPETAPAHLLEAPPADAADCAQDDCAYEREAAAEAAFGALALGAGARMSSVETERYAKAWLFSVVLHEAGHNLGLRHNFASSALFSPAQLRDRAFTRAHGVSASVMDYNPVNLSPRGEPQGELFQTHLGPYDYWAIEYGYAKFPRANTPAGELPMLRAIANETIRPEYAYGTDEDAEGAGAADPRVAPWDLSSDPLAHDGDRFRICEDLIGRLDDRASWDGRSYADQRRALVSALASMTSTAELTARFVGGIETSRAHRGQPGAPAAPLRSVPRAESRRAFALLEAHVLGPRAFGFPARVWSRVLPERYQHWGAGPPVRPDFPLFETVADVQDAALGELFSIATIARLEDQSLKARPGETMTTADLFEWTQAAVWSEALQAYPPRTIPTLRRELQRRYTDLLLKVALLPDGVLDQLRLPHELPALARHELLSLEARLARILRGENLETATLSHLEDEHSRIAHVLDAPVLRSL
jgi:hypothetical protein